MERLDEVSVVQFLPPAKRIVVHCLAIAAVSFVVGPTIGTLFFNDPRGQPIPLSAGSVLVWGLAGAFIASFFYVGWLIHRARRAYLDHLAISQMQAFGQARPEQD